jgi:hypothetical protein
LGRNVKYRGLKYLLALALVPVMAIAAASCGSSRVAISPVNDDVISYRDFSLNAASVGLSTMTEGTIFVRGSEEKAGERRVQISAQVEIDPADWGGVSFNIPVGWEVSSVTSDYPQGNPHPENYTSVLYTGSTEGQYQRIVEIGNTKHGADEPQGGIGSVIIELVPMSDNKDIGESLEIGIAVGSAEGYIMGPVNDVFTISLK